MITMLIASFVVLLLIILAMSLGVIITGKRITGTCGGLNNIEGLENACDMCTKPCEKRKKALQRLHDLEKTAQL